VPPTFTHEGGQADRHQKALQELERAVMTCLLFEDTFYEGGDSIASRIEVLAKQVPAAALVEMIGRARTEMRLRHVPLFLVVQLLGHPNRTAGQVVEGVLKAVRRPDEMGEIIALFVKGRDNGPKGPRVHPFAKLPRALVRGLAKAFVRFDAYQLAKWNRDAQIKLRDVMFLTHPKPLTPTQALIFKALAEGTLQAPDTWEVALSAGKDKRGTWTRLLADGKLGYMALLANLRNMEQASVDHALIEKALLDGAPRSWALPFRFVSALKAAPHMAQALSDAMLAALRGQPKLPGTTYVVVDVSGSMDAPLSMRGNMYRTEAASALAVYIREVAERARVFSFSNNLVEVPNVRGLPLVDAIRRSQAHGGTALAQSLRALPPGADRVIVVTDEQSSDGTVNVPGMKAGYIINVASYRPALELEGNWARISGWSERVVDYIRMTEGHEQAQSSEEE